MSIIEVALNKRRQVSLAISKDKRANIELLKARYRSFINYCRKRGLSVGFIDWLYQVTR